MEYSPGLEGVIAGETAVSNVEGDIGRLSYRGYRIETLVDLPFVGVMWLVLKGEMPTDEQRLALEDFLVSHGELSDSDRELLAAIPEGLHPMRMLQGIIPLLDVDRSIGFSDFSLEVTHGLQILARTPHLIANFHCRNSAMDLPESRPELGYLGNFLARFTGREPAREQIEILNVVQILQMEHSFNASTFAGRVVASTLAPVDAVFSAATGALHGPLHGGADEAALEQARRVGSPAGAAACVDDILACKGRLPGMGHREYRRVDPRAAILKPMAQALCAGTEHENILLTLLEMERVFNTRMKEKGKDIHANVEYYKGAVFEAIGIPARYFTAMFTMARMVGWLAHFMELRANNRILRPKALYTGPPVRA